VLLLEEVAMLAVLSTDYYTRLERGKIRGASESVLNAIARALQLDDVEREHLFDLARIAPGTSAARSRNPTTGSVRASVQRVLDNMNIPAVVVNAQQDLIASNLMGRALFAPHFEADKPNMARFIFLDSRARDFYEAVLDWSAVPAGAKTHKEPVTPGAPVLKINDLKKYYKVSANEIFGGSAEGRVVKANEAISFEARESETVAIVGESGCGKSTLAKVLLGLETASSGTVTLGNSDIQSTGIEDRDVKTVSSIQMVFQNPFDTLNPSHSVGSQIIRTLEKFGVGRNPGELRNRMLELLDLVKLPRAFAERMPRQLSGGQKQRIGVARAFAGRAQVVVADEPVSALDVSVQAAVTELLMDIQRQNKTTMLFISHDLSVVRYLADRVVVMYLGHIVEQGTTDQIFSPPYHPYTEALLSAIPIADTSVVKKHIVLEGDIPSAMDPPPGCPFQTRCRWKSRVPGDKCESEVPPLKKLGEGHYSLCWLDDAELATMEPVITFAAKETADPATENPDADAPKKKVRARSQKAKGDPAKPAARPRPSKTKVSARPGESDPAKTMTEIGQGRQAASGRVKPATSRKRPKTD
jgi:peptide/nickel transport system ATP-binding protein